MLRVPVTARSLWTLAVVSVLFCGCYTVFVHPKIEHEKWGKGEIRAACIDCHPDYNVYPYDPYDYYFGADYFWDHPRYGYYYGYPCWWEEYYWDYYYSASEEEFWYDNIAYGEYGYYDYYYYDDDYYEQDPHPYTDDEPEILDAAAPDYHGPIPRRTPSDQLPPDDESKAQRESEPEQREDDRTDTVLIRAAPELSPAPNTKRSAGQPPYSRPTGWWGAKPPKLRPIAAEAKPKTGGGSASKSKSSKKSKSSSSSSDDSKDDDDDKKEDKKEDKIEDKPAEPERRGRPKRGPP